MKTTIQRLRSNVKRLETIERKQYAAMHTDMSVALTRRHALTLRSLARAKFMLRDAERLERICTRDYAYNRKYGIATMS